MNASGASNSTSIGNTLKDSCCAMKKNNQRTSTPYNLHLYASNFLIKNKKNTDIYTYTRALGRSRPTDCIIMHQSSSFFF